MLLFLLCKTETFKKFQRRRNNYYEITHRWEASGTGKSMNWLFSSFFSWNTHGIFQCYFSILLHATYITWLPGNFFFPFAAIFLFCPLPLCPVLLFPFLCVSYFKFLRRWSDQPTSCLLDASHSTESSSFVDCSPQLCGPGQEAGWITKYTMWLWSVRRMGRAVSRKSVWLEQACWHLKVSDSTRGCHDFCLSGILVFYLWQQFYWRE